jgi:hypothetical protein
LQSGVIDRQFQPAPRAQMKDALYVVGTSVVGHDLGHPE